MRSPTSSTDMATSITDLALPPHQEAAVREAACQIVTYGRRLSSSGLVLGSAGNLSVRVGQLIVISPTSVDYDAIGEDDVCLMGWQSEQLAGAGRPSSEYLMHRLVYDSSPAQAVVHTHSTAAVAVSTVCEEIPAVHYSVLRLGGPTIRTARYERFGSDGLARSAVTALNGRFGALLQNHGAITYGASLAEAFLRAELIEWLADVWARARLLGEPRILSESELAAVAEEARRRRYAGAAQ